LLFALSIKKRFRDVTGFCSIGDRRLNAFGAAAVAIPPPLWIYRRLYTFSFPSKHSKQRRVRALIQLVSPTNPRLGDAAAMANNRDNLMQQQVGAG